MPCSSAAGLARPTRGSRIAKRRAWPADGRLPFLPQVAEARAAYVEAQQARMQAEEAKDNLMQALRNATFQARQLASSRAAAGLPRDRRSCHGLPAAPPPALTEPPGAQHRSRAPRPTSKRCSSRARTTWAGLAGATWCGW